MSIIIREIIFSISISHVQHCNIVDVLFKEKFLMRKEMTFAANTGKASLIILLF